MKNYKSVVAVFLCSLLMLTGCIARKTVEEVPEVVEASTDNSSEKKFTLTPVHTENSDPENWDIQWEILQNGEPVSEYKRDEEINFKKPEDYFSLEGISTFRGNNYRNDAAYGTADIFNESLEILWTNTIGSLGKWSGCGWSGQPLIVRWEESTKDIMNIYPDKKQKIGLTEVIYATMDGNIYFYDIDDGKPTRDKLNVGMTFKGTGTLDPRGYPIMYIGSGIETESKSQRMFAINLIDTTVIYEQSGSDPDCYRSWPAFDSSPIIHAETDTLIWPGENGVLYTIKLNTEYKPEEKTITINPENVAKVRYKINHPSKRGRWLGFESSCVVVGNYLYVSDNIGMFYCVDLNTMELVWAQDVLDDSNSSPAFQWDSEGNGYVYTAPSLRWTAQGGKGSTTIFKLNAQTGEIIWSIPYECRSREGVSGGVQSSPIIGRKDSDLEGLVIYNVAFSPSGNTGKLVAINAETGDIVWEHHMANYTWSSPVAVYNPDGKGYVLICDSAGNVKMINGSDGELIDSVNIGANVESSPAVFENTLVVGTRGCRICGIKIK